MLNANDLRHNFLLVALKLKLFVSVLFLGQIDGNGGILSKLLVIVIKVLSKICKLLCTFQLHPIGLFNLDTETS